MCLRAHRAANYPLVGINVERRLGIESRKFVNAREGGQEFDGAPSRIGRSPKWRVRGYGRQGDVVGQSDRVPWPQ